MRRETGILNSPRKDLLDQSLTNDEISLLYLSTNKQTMNEIRKMEARIPNKKYPDVKLHPGKFEHEHQKNLTKPEKKSSENRSKHDEKTSRCEEEEDYVPSSSC